MASSECYDNSPQFIGEISKSVVLVRSNERTMVSTPDDRYSDDYEPASKLMRTNVVNKLLEDNKNGKNKSEEKENTRIVREGGGRGRRKQTKPVRISVQENEADELDLTITVNQVDLSSHLDSFVAQNNLCSTESILTHDAFDEMSLCSVNKSDGCRMDSDISTTMCNLCGKIESSQTALAVHIQLAHSKTSVDLLSGGMQTTDAAVEYPTEYHRLGSELQQEVEESNLESRYVAKNACVTDHNLSNLSSSSGTVHGSDKERKLESPSIASGDHNGPDGVGERNGLDADMFLIAKQQQYNRGLSINSLSKTSTQHNETGASSVQSIDWSAIFNVSAATMDLPIHNIDAHGVYQATKVALMAPQNQRSATCTPVQTSPVLQSVSSTLLSGTGSASAGSMYLPFLKSDSLGSAFRQAGGTSGGSADTDDYCDRCQKHFCNKYYLRKHKQDVHGVGPGGATIPLSSGTYQTPPPNNSFMISGLHGSAALSNNTNSRITSTLTNQSSSFPLLNTSLPVVLPFHNTLGSVNSIGGLIPSSISSQSSISHAELLAASGLLPGISSMANLMPGLKNMANLLPGLTSMSNLMPSLTSMSSLMPGLTSMANMVPGLTSISSLMFLNPFASPLTILKAGSPFLQGSPNFASASLNTLAELQNATNCSTGGVSSLSGLDGQEPGSVDTSGRNIMYQFDSSSMGSSADQAMRCDICQKEFCNSYFVKVHKRDKHGIQLQAEAGNSLLSSSKASQLSLPAVPGVSGLQFHIGGHTSGANSDLGDSGGNISNEIKQERGVTSAASSLDIGAISSLDDTCGLCKKQFTNRYSLMMHLINTHNIKPEGFGLASELLQLDKLNVLQAGSKYTASMTMRGNILPTTTNNASQSAKLSDRVSCDICNKEVCNKYFLKTHKMKVHGLDSHQAEMTGGGGVGIGLGSGVIDGGGGPDNKFFAAVFEAAAMMDAKQRLDQHVSAVKNIDGDLMKSFYAMLAEKDLKLKQNNSQFSDKTLMNINYNNNNSEREMSAKRQRHRHQNSERMRLRRSIARLGGSGGEGAGGSGGSDEMTTTLGLIASHKGESDLGGYASRDGISGGVAGGQLQSLALNLGLQMAAAGEALQMPNLDRSGGGLPGAWRHLSSWHTGGGESSTLTSTSPTTMAGETKSGVEKPSEEDLIKSGIDPEAYCEICQKEFCSKYFLKTHRQKIHGLVTTSQVAPIIDNSRQLKGITQFGLPLLNPFTSNSEIISQITTYNSLPSSQPNDMSASVSQFEPPILCPVPLMTAHSLSAAEMKCDESTGNGSFNDGNNYSSTRSRENVAPNMTRVTCQICSKELCNKYFLKTHMIKLHGSSATSASSGVTGLGIPDFPGNGAQEHSNSESSTRGNADVNIENPEFDSKSIGSTKSVTAVKVIADESVEESIGGTNSRKKVSKTLLTPSLDIMSQKIEMNNEIYSKSDAKNNDNLQCTAMKKNVISLSGVSISSVSTSDEIQSGNKRWQPDTVDVEQSVLELSHIVNSEPLALCRNDQVRLGEEIDMNRTKHEAESLKPKCVKTIIQKSEQDQNGVPSTGCDGKMNAAEPHVPEQLNVVTFPSDNQAMQK